MAYDEGLAYRLGDIYNPPKSILSDPFFLGQVDQQGVIPVSLIHWQLTGKY